MHFLGGLSFFLLFLALGASSVLSAPILPLSVEPSGLPDLGRESISNFLPINVGPSLVSTTPPDTMPNNVRHRLLVRREATLSIYERGRASSRSVPLVKRNGFTDFFKNIGHKIKSGFQNLGNKIKTGFQNFGNKVKEIAHKVKDGVVKAAHKVKDAFKHVGNKIKQAAQKVWHAVKHVGNKIKEVAQKGWAKVKEVAKHVGSKIKEGVGKAVDWVKKNGAKVAKFALKIGATVAGVVSTVAKFIPIPGLNSIASKALKGVAMGIKAGSDAIHANLGWQLEKASKVMDWVGSPLSTAAKQLGGKAGAALGALDIIA